ncbi:major facilitator superfamily domain-containing protein [Limtongia smithiae]|uniref:major facilitator superfamily domain-containing protein n=1 Tax=Limtongia smithiae TaxID=1125753 RepID=UPI0034CE2749
MSAKPPTTTKDQLPLDQEAATMLADRGGATLSTSSRAGPRYDPGGRISLNADDSDDDDSGNETCDPAMRPTLATRLRAAIVRFFHEIGFLNMVKAPFDVRILLVQHFSRVFAFGTSTLIMTLYFNALGFPKTVTGLLETGALMGDLVISFVLSMFADTVGRRRIIRLSCLLMCASGVVFALSDNVYVLLVTCILGIVSPSGSEVGPFRAIEESTIAHLTPVSSRADVYSWYALIGRFGMALGTMFCGTLVQALQEKYEWSNIRAYKFAFIFYALMAFIMFIGSFMLSDECELELVRQRKIRNQEREAESVENSITERQEESNESVELLVDNTEEPEELSRRADDLENEQPKKRRGIREYLPKLTVDALKTLAILVPLIFLDSFGGGLAGNGWIAFYFKDRFGVKEGTLGRMFFFANLIAMGSALVSAAIARHIGLVQTMLVAHVPSSIALGLIPSAATFGLGRVLFFIRAGTHMMDQAPRQAFISSIVSKDERTNIMAIVSVVRTLSNSAGPTITGTFAGQGRIWISFVLAMSVKLMYDFGVMSFFLRRGVVRARS